MYNNQSGLLATVGTDVTNSTSATTINFGVAPDFATITGSNFIKLELDPGATTFEIVYLTSYMQGATTGTVTRSAEDSTNWPASTHPSGTWVNAPTVADFFPIPSGSASVGNAIIVAQVSPLALSFETVGTFTAAGQLFVGTGNGTGEVLNSGSTNAVLMVGGSDASGLEWQSLGTETVNVVAVSGVSQTLSLVGNDITLSANCTLTMPSPARGAWCYSLVRQSAALGPYTATFTSVKWPSSTPPVMSTGASAVDRYDFVCDGTTWYGIIVGQSFG